jgi:hypothetical protein
MAMSSLDAERIASSIADTFRVQVAQHYVTVPGTSSQEVYDLVMTLLLPVCDDTNIQNKQLNRHGELEEIK